jgi:hypothetical protein
MGGRPSSGVDRRHLVGRRRSRRTRHTAARQLRRTPPHHGAGRQRPHPPRRGVQTGLRLPPKSGWTLPPKRHPTADRARKSGASRCSPVQPVLPVLAGICSWVHGRAAGFVYAPGRIRTCDPRLRRPSLYPAELRGLVQQIDGFRIRRRRTRPLRARVGIIDDRVRLPASRCRSVRTARCLYEPGQISVFSL